MRRILLYGALAWLSALGPQTSADTDLPQTQLPDTIVVTANRFGQSQNQSVWPAAAISQQSISTSISMQEALDGRFGLDLRQTSGVGSISTLSNWGTFNRHMLLLYNGRVLRDYSLGGFNLSDFSSDEFERIELLKGPQSAFYGADAIGGVVNLISRTSLVDKLEILTRVGSYDLRQYRLDASKRAGIVGLGGFGEWNSAENNRPNAGSERKLFGLRSDHISQDGRFRVAGSLRYFTDSLGVPGPVPDPSWIPVYGNREASSLNDHQKDENYSGDLSYRFAPDARTEAQLDLFWEKKNLDYNSLYNYQFYYYTPDGADSALNIDSVDVHSRTIYNKRSAGISGRVQKQFNYLSTGLGIDFLSGSLRATSDDRNFGSNIAGPFAPYAYNYESYNFWSRGQDQFDIWGSTAVSATSGVKLDASGRIQFVHNRATQPSYNLGILATPKSWLRLKLGYGYAFRLPSISDQFADEVFIQGKADLNPETSHSLIGTIEADLFGKTLLARLTGFSQQVDSLIQYLYDPSIFRSIPHNVHRFRSNGLDVSLSLQLPVQHQVTWGGVYQKAEQTVASGQYIDAHYVPDIKWRLDWQGKAIRRLTYNLNLSYTSNRSIILYTGETKTIAYVYELGASVTIPVASFAELSVIGYDLTDERRPDQFGFVANDGDYPTPGRRLVAQLRVNVR
jgi:outer membrane receptor protein involved in Fe transport